METAEVLLPHGVFRDGALLREATLRPLTGHDESWLAQRRAASAAEASTLLLARLVRRVGDAKADLSVVRGLIAGDREALLLHALRLSFGERVEAVLACPACREPMDLDLAVEDLLLPPYEDAAPEHALVARDGCRAAFRLPTGADLEAAGAAGSPAEGARTLLARCVRAAQDGAGRALDGPWPSALLDAVDAAMPARDPQADVRFDLACPACGGAVAAELDAGGYLSRRLASPARLLRDVHALASRYHWSERDVLALAPRRRAAYLQLLDEEFSGGSA